MPHPALKVGSIEVIPLCDARVPLPIAEELPVELEEGWSPYRERYPWAFLGPATWDFHIHAFVLQTPDGLVLIDTGIGTEAAEAWGAVSGSLAVELAIAGVEPTDIDHVIHTHLHLDHIGGAILPDGEPRFPFATHHVHRADWEAFLAAEDPDDRSAFERMIRPLADRDRLSASAEDAEILPGVQVLHAPGHTPGHRAVLVESRGRALLITGDALHHPFQVSHPEWRSTHDMDPELGVSTRMALLDRARRDGHVVCVPHFAVPFGHVSDMGWMADAGAQSLE